MEPKVSVVIAAYNKAGLTVRTVESVLSQTYPNLEIIVVDDGSTDNTKQRLASYGKKIKYVYKQNGGACSARNLGIKLSQGEYIGLLDCDDLYFPQKIDRSITYLRENPQFGFVYSAAYYIDQDDNILRKYADYKNPYIGWISQNLVVRNFICNSTVVIRKSCFDKAGFFDQAIFTPADWDMWIRLSQNYQAGYIREALTKYRFTDSYILSNIKQAKREEMTVLTKTFFENNDFCRLVRRKAFSNIYRRAAVSYLLVGDFSRAKQELISALKINRFGWGALLLLLFFLLSAKTLQKIVKAKVIRNFGR